VTVEVCPNGHPTPTSADRDKQGLCLTCRREYTASYNTKRSAAMQLAIALESHGVQVTTAGVDRGQLAAQIAAALRSTTNNAPESL
jgi:hypothetical protein